MAFWRWLLQTWTGRFFLIAILHHVSRLLKRRKSLAHKTIVITGGASGIGREIAFEAGRRGCNIVLWDIDEARLNVTLGEVANSFPSRRVFGLRVDVADADAVYAAAKRTLEEVGFVHAVVNNAGIVTGRYLLETPECSIRRTFDVNVLSHFWVSKAFLPLMIARNEGHLVFVASVAGMHGAARMVDYCASKFAVVGLEESLRGELLKQGVSGVRTTCVCPAHVTTDLFKGYNPGTAYTSLTPRHVAARVIEAIQKEQVMVLLPAHLWLAGVVKAVFPTEWADTLKWAVRVHDSMDTWDPQRAR